MRKSDNYKKGHNQIDTVEVSGSSPLVPTIKIKDLRTVIFRKSFLIFVSQCNL